MTGVRNVLAFGVAAADMEVLAMTRVVSFQPEWRDPPWVNSQ